MADDRPTGQNTIPYGEEPTNDDEIIAIARRRFQETDEHENPWRNVAREDLRFSLGEQWPSEIFNARQVDQRPTLTINRLPQFIHRITNDQRQNRPAVRVSPVDDSGDEDTAEVYQGIIRHIEYNSDAEDAYDTAFDMAVRVGRGYLRLNIEYLDNYSFDQDITFSRIRNPFQVYMDPHSIRADYRDMQFCFVREQMSKDEFKKQWPDADLSESDKWNMGDMGSWVTDDAVWVAEYWYIEKVPMNLVEIQMGPDEFQSMDYDREYLKLYPSEMPDEWRPKIVRRRRSWREQVKWVKMCGWKILERTDWPGKWIPIVPVLGEEVYAGEKVELSGIVRYAKDPQRMYNYWASAETETIALAPKAPWVVVDEQIEGYESQWKQANTRNWAYLPIRSITDSRGNPVAPPTRNVFEPATQAITNARMMAAEDLKSTMGIYDASLGMRSNETSGVAIARRQVEGDTSTYHFVDNLGKSIRHVGRILIDLIPQIYNAGRVIRILGEDMSEKVMQVGQDINLENGRYDVIVDTGPNFRTKRQEAAESMVDMTRAYPQLMQVGGDLLIKNLDWPGAQELAERVRRTIPPELLQESQDPETQLAALQGMVQQMQQQLEAMNALAKEQEQKLDDLETDKQKLEVQAKSKDDELVLEKYEIDLKNDIERTKLAIEEQKLQLEWAQLEIQRQQSTVNNGSA